MNGQAEVFLVAPAMAFFISKSINSAAKHLAWKDIRRRKGDPRPDSDLITAFLKKQPEIDQSDWEIAAGRTTPTPIGIEVLPFRDALFLAFQFESDIYKILRIAPTLSFYLVDMVRDAERDGMVDISNADSPTHYKN
jgi:hypothetical protein